MFLKLRPLLYSLVFIVSLEAITIFHRHVVSIVGLLFLLSIYHGRLAGGKWKFAFLPVFFSLSSVALLYLISGRVEQQIFIFLAAGLYYLALFGAYRLNLSPADKTARGMNMAATAGTIFFTYAGAYGLYLNFLVPLWSLMLAYLAVTLLVSYQYFCLIENKSKRKIWIYSFVLSLVMAEISWTINYWPFGYLTAGATALILYYILWDIAQSHLLDILSQKRAVANLVLFSFLILLVLATSKWVPVI